MSTSLIQDGHIMRLGKLLFLLVVVLAIGTFLYEMSNPFDVLTGYSISKKMTIHGVMCGIGFILIIAGYGGFLGRSINVCIYLINNKGINQVRKWVIEVMMGGVAGIIGIALWYYLGVLRHL